MRTESYEFQPYELSFARAQFRRHVQNGSPLMSRVRVNRVTLTVGWPLPVYPDQTDIVSLPRHALLVVAFDDRTGRVPSSLDALDLLADLARGRAERVDADLAVRHAGAQRAELGCGIVLRQTGVERLVLQLGEIRRDLGSRITPARLVLVGGGAQRLKADLGISEARAHMGKLLRGVALALAQLGGLRL